MSTKKKNVILMEKNIYLGSDNIIYNNKFNYFTNKLIES